MYIIQTHIILAQLSKWRSACQSVLVFAGVVGFHSALPSMFANDPEPNNPIRALFFNGYNDQGATPAKVAAFEVFMTCN